MLENLFAGEELSTGGAGDESRSLGAVKRGSTGDRILKHIIYAKKSIDLYTDRISFAYN